MRGMSSIIVGILLAGAGAWLYMEGGFGTEVLVLVAAGALLGARGCMGSDISSVDDVAAPIEFLRNPAGAIVDEATDRLTEMLTQKKQPEPEPVSTFDPDAAIARYLENRPVQEAAPPQHPPIRGFGRKGL